MFYLGNHHLDAFKQNQIYEFKERMVVHLRKSFPQQCNQVSDEQLRESISYGIKRANRHCITTERDICQYINIMCTLGPHFDEDNTLLWAADILRDNSISNSTKKIDILYEKTIQYLNLLKE